MSGTRGAWRSTKATRSATTRWRSGARGPDPNEGTGPGPTYVSTDTHWWEASQLYGTSDAPSNARRAQEGGRLAVGDDGRPPKEVEDQVQPSRRGEHTIEWTPAMCAHRTATQAMHINWSGLFKEPVRIGLPNASP